MTLSCCFSPQQLSPYPVILSLENHCGLEQQAVMAHHLRTILGDMLVTQALDSQNPEELPSPEVMLPEPQLRRGRVCLRATFPVRPFPPLCLHLPLLLPSSDIFHVRVLAVSHPPIWTRPTPPSHRAFKAFRDPAPIPLLSLAATHRVPASSAIPASKALVDNISTWSSLPSHLACQAPPA